MAGEYGRLVQLAQADDDPAHRQLAMAQIAIMGPFVGFHAGSNPADAMAAAVIERLYPKPVSGPQDEVAARIAAIEAEALAKIEEIIAEATP